LYEQARSDARNRRERDAAALVYFAALLASAVAELDLEFRTLLHDINGLDPAWTDKRRNQLGDKIQDLATSETRLHQLVKATSFLRKRAQATSSWRRRILHFRDRDAELDGSLDTLVATGDEVLRLIGTRPPEVDTRRGG
jgi:hypothetical protein